MPAADPGASLQLTGQADFWHPTGGGVRSGPGPADGFVHDHCSAFYPLAAASRVRRALDLERYGLRWSYGKQVLAHSLPDGRAAGLSRDVAHCRWTGRAGRR
jgi:phytoene dehydrogenase-like protein